MNYLGLDYGLTHLGIALADGPLASPLTTISTKKAAKILPILIDTHRIDEIVIGLPDKTLKFEFDKFLNSLKILNLKFQIVDETLSTKEAIQKLMHTSQTRRRVKQHAVAATLLLQSFLDSQ